jgi:sugar phosphate isomerase/epimerase
MRRRSFLMQAGGVSLTATLGPLAQAARPKAERLGLGTVTFRSRFAQTKPEDSGPIAAPLTLLDVPAYYRKRFGVRKLEFWSHHFESLEPAYLASIRGRIDAAGAELVNVQVDAPYNLASVDEAERQRSLATVRRWVDAAVALGSRAVRVNPGKTGGSVDQSIASLREVNGWCLTKRLPLLTENHFGLEMDPEIHLAIRAAVDPKNVYTLPDFGNYPVETMFDSLAKVLPFAYVISAKAVDFDAQGKHLSYDFDRCIQMCERAGFKGTYLVEQWSKTEQPIDSERIADWLLQHVRENLR